MRATHEFVHSNPQITARPSVTSSRNFGKELNQIWQRLITLLAGSSDPRIQRISEANWRVFDPKTNRSLSFTSEQEVRVWLDERYSF